MPVKRRRDKRRNDEIEMWSDYFQFGHDMLWRLHSAGISEEAAAATAESVWRRIGADVIEFIEAQYAGREAPKRPFWADEMFGPPNRLQFQVAIIAT